MRCDFSDETGGFSSPRSAALAALALTAGGGGGGETINTSPKGKVWDKDKKNASTLSESVLDDDSLYEAGRDLAGPAATMRRSRC